MVSDFIILIFGVTIAPKNFYVMRSVRNNHPRVVIGAAIEEIDLRYWLISINLIRKATTVKFSKATGRSYKLLVNLVKKSKSQISEWNIIYC